VNPEGSLDSTFNGDGIVSISLVNGFSIGYFSSIQVQFNGKIMVFGSFSGNTNNDFVLNQVNP
jgi:hypothetical protein